MFGILIAAHLLSRSKSREVKVRELPGAELAVEDSNQDETGQEEVELGMEEVTMDTSHLSEFECTAVKKKGKRSKNNKAQGIQKDLEEVDIFKQFNMLTIYLSRWVRKRLAKLQC